MPVVVQLLGRIGDFYDNLGPAQNPAHWRSFFAACTDSTFGKSWTQISKTACGTAFKSLVKDFHSNLPDNYEAKRTNQTIGTFIPIFNSTTMLFGKESVDAWKHVKQVYDDGGPDDAWVYKPEFDKYFRVGYWGNPADLKTAAAVKSFGDYKSSLFFALGERPWWQVMYRSASEPGLSHALPYDELVPDENGVAEEVLTTGGWSDGHSVLVLKALGCEHVVYITRQGPDSNFAKGVAKSLGMSDDEKHRLFDVEKVAKEPFTSFEKSVVNASGVWCTNWDGTKLDPNLLYEDGQNAVFQVNDDFFTDTKRFPTPYSKATKHSNQLGCEVTQEK
jgi:hypothetical protein